MVHQRVLLTIVIIMLAIVVFLAWIDWNEGHFGWPHLIGLGASVLILVVVWFWPGIRQPTQPPP
jgi:hypothetical protein